VGQPTYGSHGDPIEVVPVVVVSQSFPARPSFIPDIKDFVRRCLADSPLDEDGTREVGETVFRALLDAAGPTGSIQVAFRIFPEHVEVDVLHSESQPQEAASAYLQATGMAPARPAMPPAPVLPLAPVRPLVKAPEQEQSPAAAKQEQPLADTHSASFAEWMSTALRREGMTQEAAARQLGVSVKTVSRWVGGATQPRMRDLKRIREVFGEVPLH
jgi:DNA-binding transcriptional regulator YiaG